ncbi:MAG: DUF924 family protein [Pseudomonadota bacterium]
MSDDFKEKIDAVLHFWFEECRPEQWYKKDTVFDAHVEERLGGHHAAAAKGDYDAWKETARGALALTILLDQVPRNIFRDEARAFATDAMARSVVRDALSRGLDAQLSQIERCFLYLPLEHSEDLADQEDTCRLMKALDEYPAFYDYALAHHRIIDRFGRFPHRNDILGRSSTAEETEFLSQPDSSF